MKGNFTGFGFALHHGLDAVEDLDWVELGGQLLPVHSLFEEPPTPSSKPPATAPTVVAVAGVGVVTQLPPRRRTSPVNAIVRDGGPTDVEDVPTAGRGGPPPNTLLTILALSLVHHLDGSRLRREGDPLLRALAPAPAPAPAPALVLLMLLLLLLLLLQLLLLQLLHEGVDAEGRACRARAHFDADMDLDRVRTLAVVDVGVEGDLGADGERLVASPLGELGAVEKQVDGFAPDSVADVNEAEAAIWAVDASEDGPVIRAHLVGRRGVAADHDRHGRRPHGCPLVPSPRSRANPVLRERSEWGETGQGRGVGRRVAAGRAWGRGAGREVGRPPRIVAQGRRRSAQHPG